MPEHINPRAEAQSRGLTDEVEFLVMDALRPLEFPDDAFDLVNLRIGSSFLLVQDLPRVLGELLRVTRPRGVVRVTDCEIMKGTSPAYNRFLQTSRSFKSAGTKTAACI